METSCLSLISLRLLSWLSSTRNISWSKVVICFKPIWVNNGSRTFDQRKATFNYWWKIPKWNSKTHITILRIHRQFQRPIPRLPRHWHQSMQFITLCRVSHPIQRPHWTCPIWKPTVPRLIVPHWMSPAVPVPWTRVDVHRKLNQMSSKWSNKLDAIPARITRTSVDTTQPTEQGLMQPILHRHRPPPRRRSIRHRSNQWHPQQSSKECLGIMNRALKQIRPRSSTTSWAIRIHFVVFIAPVASVRRARSSSVPMKNRPRPQRPPLPRYQRRSQPHVFPTMISLMNSMNWTAKARRQQSLELMIASNICPWWIPLRRQMPWIQRIIPIWWVDYHRRALTLSHRTTPITWVSARCLRYGILHWNPFLESTSPGQTQMSSPEAQLRRTPYASVKKRYPTQQSHRSGYQTPPAQQPFRRYRMLDDNDLRASTHTVVYDSSKAIPSSTAIPIRRTAFSSDEPRYSKSSFGGSGNESDYDNNQSVYDFSNLSKYLPSPTRLMSIPVNDFNQSNELTRIDDLLLGDQNEIVLHNDTSLHPTADQENGDQGDDDDEDEQTEVHVNLSDDTDDHHHHDDFSLPSPSLLLNNPQSDNNTILSTNPLQHSSNHRTNHFTSLRSTALDDSAPSTFNIPYRKDPLTARKLLDIRSHLLLNTTLDAT